MQTIPNLFLILGLICFSSAAFADATLHYAGTQGKLVYKVTPKNARMDVMGKDGRMSILYRKKTITIVNHEEKSYTVLTPKMMKRISGLVGGSGMNAMMAEKMKHLPPEKRKQMMAMMGSMVPQAKKDVPKAPLKLQKVGKEKVGKYSTTRWKATRKGKTLSEFWSASYSQVGVSKSDMGGIKALAKTIQKFVKSLGSLTSNLSESMGLENSEAWEKGLPVRIRSKDWDAKLQKVSTRKLNKSVFLPNKSYTRKKMGQR